MTTGLTRFRSPFWSTTAFRLVLAACAGFLALTTAAMLVYPGGTFGNPETRSYSFFLNFFSDLGRTVAHNGQPNAAGTLLFGAGLTCAGLGLMLFFVAFLQFFVRQLWLSSLATAAGIAAGGCFVGVACTPANISGPAHAQFTTWAFRLFLVAVLLYCIAIYRNRAYPRALGFVFLVFTALLDGYLWLLTRGPEFNTLSGLIIQATGQKIIAYAAILCVGVQAFAALRLPRKAEAPA